MSRLSRRQFIQTSGLFAAGSAVLPQGRNGVQTVQAQETKEKSPKPKKWFKGQLHTHSQWSDGGGLPEIVCHFYKENGYEFFCLSDHNNFQNDSLRFKGFGFQREPEDKSLFEGETSTWKFVNTKKGWAQLTQTEIDQAISVYGKDSVKIKTDKDGTRYVRLKTFRELQEQFEEEGRFLLIPGFEQTGSSEDGLQVHMNFINVKESFPYVRKADVAETINANFEKGKEVYANNPEPYLFTLNHPQWPFYDVTPEALVQLDKIHFWELTNNPLTGGPVVPNAWTPEKYWDVVNAYRIANRKRVLWGTGSDDLHPLDLNSNPFLGWNMVLAEELTARAIMEAMLRGDFYVSNGVTLKDVQFCPESKTLSVSVDPNVGEGVKIEFIGTKKTFSRPFEKIEYESPRRTISAYAENIGVVLKTIEGLEGSYAMQPDDLYVRARVTTAASKEDRPQYQILFPTAWTQPYAN